MLTDAPFRRPVSAGIAATGGFALALAKAFLRWWSAELLALLPRPLRSMSRRKGLLVLMLDDVPSAAMTVFTDDVDDPAVIAGFAVAPGTNEARSAVRSLLQRRELAARVDRDELGLCLRLPARQALCRTFELPIAAEDNVREVIGYELDRYTPFRPEQVYFCYRVLSRDAAAQRLAVEVTLVPRAIADQALRAARDLGWTPERMDVAGAAAGDAHSDNLLPPASAPRRNGARVTRGLAIAAATLTFAALAISFVTIERQAAAVSQEAADIQRHAAIAAGLRKEIAALRDGEDFPVAQKHRFPTVSGVLEELTRLLPDNTWLTELRISGHDIELTGVSASASALIGILEKSGMFRNTSFRSPVTPDQSSGRERLSIAAQIVSEPRR